MSLGLRRKDHERTLASSVPSSTRSPTSLTRYGRGCKISQKSKRWTNVVTSEVLPPTRPPSRPTPLNGAGLLSTARRSARIQLLLMQRQRTVRLWCRSGDTPMVIERDS